MKKIYYCFLPSENPYGIALISVGNCVRLNYKVLFSASHGDAP